MDRQKPIVVQQAFSVSPEQLWMALTEPQHMREWFFENIPDFKAEKGFQTRFPVEAGGKVFTHLWHIIEVVPVKRIGYQWEYLKYPGTAFVTFSLEPSNDGTLLTVTNEGLASFPAEIPEFSRASCEGGWRYFIQERLKAYIDQQSTS